MLHWLWIPPEEQAWSTFVAVNIVKKAIHRLRHPNIIQGRRQWHPTPVLLPRKFHGQRSLVGCSSWGHHELDTTEQLHFHFSLSHIGEGNGNHSSVLAWRILGTGEPGGLPSMGSHRVRHDWSDLASSAAILSKRRIGMECVWAEVGEGGQAKRKERKRMKM